MSSMDIQLAVRRESVAETHRAQNVDFQDFDVSPIIPEEPLKPRSKIRTFTVMLSLLVSVFSNSQKSVSFLHHEISMEKRKMLIVWGEIVDALHRCIQFYNGCHCCADYIV